jgi:4-methyl-5(b-hydroxyethyl)-thiazole monophosphate biosynthesis
MPTVLVILPEGFEELEAVAPIDVLRRAGCTVTLAALSPDRRVTGRNQITIEADTLLASLLPPAPAPASASETAAPIWDCLLLPGGPGVTALRASPAVRELIARHHAVGKLLAAICAAPAVLYDAGLLAGRRYTAHPSVAAELPAILADQRVVHDGNILTSRGAGTALDFGLALAAALVSPEKSAEIAASIRA